MTKEEMIQIIDSEADIVRALVVGDPVRAFEYQWAENEALSFKESGYAADPVPAAVSAWAQAKGWTPRQAADDILQAAQLFRSTMAGLRTARLVGKEGVRAAASEQAATAAYQTALATIRYIRDQVSS